MPCIYMRMSCRLLLVDTSQSRRSPNRSVQSLTCLAKDPMLLHTAIGSPDASIASDLCVQKALCEERMLRQCLQPIFQAFISEEASGKTFTLTVVLYVLSDVTRQPQVLSFDFRPASRTCTSEIVLKFKDSRPCRQASLQTPISCRRFL